MNSGVHFFRPVPSGHSGGGLGSPSMESRAQVWTRAHGDDSDAEAALPPISCRALCCDGTIVHHSSTRQNHRLESRMREIRLSGSEGGPNSIGSPYPYLTCALSGHENPSVFPRPVKRLKSTRVL